MQPKQQAITPAWIAAALVALIAPTADLLSTFGLYTFTAAEQAAVTKMIFALAAFAAVIVAADAHLRAARNKARAQIEAAKPTPAVGAGVASWSDHVQDVEVSHGGLEQLDSVFHGLESDPKKIPRDTGDKRSVRKGKS